MKMITITITRSPEDDEKFAPTIYEQRIPSYEFDLKAVIAVINGLTVPEKVVDAEYAEVEPIYVPNPRQHVEIFGIANSEAERDEVKPTTAPEETTESNPVATVAPFEDIPF